MAGPGAVGAGSYDGGRVFFGGEHWETVDCSFQGFRCS